MSNDPSVKDSFSGEDSNPIQIKDIYYILIERLWVIGLFVVLCLIAAGIYIVQSPILYTSSVVLELEPKEQKVVNFDSVSQEELGDKDILKTFTQNLKTRIVFERIVEKGDLLKDKDFLAPFPGDNFNLNSVVAILTPRVDISVRKGTRLIDVDVDHENPVVAQKLANLLIYQALRLRIEQRANASAIASEFLRDEAVKQKAKLKESEDRLQAYQEKLGTVSLHERQDTVTQKLKELNQNLTEVKAARIQMDSQLKEAEKNQGDAQSMQTLASGTSDPAAMEIRNRISEQEALIGNLTQRYKEKHPKMIQARSQLNELKESLARLVSPERLKSAYANVLAKEKNFQDALQEQENEALDLNRKAIEYNVISRDVETDRLMYESITKRMSETDLAKGLETPDARIIEPASLPTGPSKPKKTLIMAGALFAGLMLGTMAAFGLHFLDDTFKTVDQVESVLNLPVLGALPLTAAADEDKHDFKKGLYIVENPDSALSEAFRSLRAALGLLGREDQRKTFLFTSALPEEGKSFVCASIGATFSQQKLRTLIIDADLRKPRLSKIFGLDRHDEGLSTCLTSSNSVDGMICKTESENLWVLPSGPRVPNPSELLSQPAFGELLEYVSKKYDRVIVDTAPIHAVSDTLTLVPLVHTVCLVLRARKTPRNAVIRALDMIARAGVRPAGVVVNRLPQNRGMGYYYYYTHYEDYGQKVYGTKASAK